MTADTRLTVVLPCFNEAARIEHSLAALESWFGAGAEILVVDDGSGDGTADRAERYARERGNVRVHRLPQHRGKGAALRAAIPLVQTGRVVFLDADLAFDRASVERAVDALADAEMAIGSRRHEHSYYTAPVRLFRFLYRRHVAGLLFNRFVRLATGLKFRDTQCGLKAFRRDALERIAPALTVEGFALDVEILLVATALGVRTVEVPVNVRYETPKSSVSLAVSGWPMVSDIVGMAVRAARGWYAPARLKALAESDLVTRSAARDRPARGPAPPVR